MNRRLLVVLVAAGTLAATACGASPSPTSAPETTTAQPTGTGGASGSGADRSSSDELGALQDEADRVLEALFEADRDLDYRTIETLTSRAIAARYRSQELLASIEGLDPSLKVPASESVTVTNDLEVATPEGGAVTTTGSVTVTYADADGTESTYTYTDIVFEQDGDDLLVADWRRDGASLPASSAFLDTSETDPSTAGDVTVTLEPGYRDPDGDPAFVEYLFTISNGSDLDVELHDVEMMTPDAEVYDPQFGVADAAEPGDTTAARIGFEGPSVPVSGGTLTITLEDGDGDRSIVLVDVPPFLDEDGEPEAQRSVELDDVEFSASGTIGTAGGDPETDPSSDPEVLQEITDAAAFRDSLLSIAREENDPGDPADAWGIPDAWLAAVPGLELVGFQIEATPTTVSGFSLTGDKDGTVEGLPFAVMDASGRCAGGVVMGAGGEPVAFRTVDLTSAPSCDAAAVIDLVGLG